jgi:RIP metalloprotease RseP
MLAAFEPLGVVMTVVGLGGLIFFHELGHFLACRLTGTRVEAFSVGFGQEIYGWTRNGTRYRIGLIPLGGYVKMAAENPGERNTGAPDEFPNKPFAARLFIMSAGVIFNLILAFLLFVWAFGIGVPLQSRLVGLVDPGSPAWRAGLKPGDVVTRVDGTEILDFTDILTEDALGGDGPVALTIERDGRPMELTLRPGAAQGESRLGIHPALVFGESVAQDSPAARAGGQPGDTILSINGTAVGSPWDIDEIIRRAATAGGEGDAIDLSLRVRRRSGSEADLKVSIPYDDKRPFIGITPFEGPTVDAVAGGSVADGLVQPGDELIVNGSPVRDLQLLRDRAEPITSCVAVRGGQEVPLALPAGTTVGDLGDAVAGRRDAEKAIAAERPGGARRDRARRPDPERRRRAGLRVRGGFEGDPRERARPARDRRRAQWPAAEGHGDARPVAQGARLQHRRPDEAPQGAQRRPRDGARLEADDPLHRDGRPHGQGPRHPARLGREHRRADLPRDRDLQHVRPRLGPLPPHPRPHLGQPRDP